MHTLQISLHMTFAISSSAEALCSAGFVRYWLGAGRGGFAISSRECINPSFYCMMTTLKEGSPTLNPGSDYLRGRTVKTSPIPAKHPYFAVIKSNNYLPNVLATLDAESEHKDYVRFCLSLTLLMSAWLNNICS